MFITAAAIFTVFLHALTVLADPIPQEPQPGAIFKEGGPCQISWSADQAGQWSTMNIELMTGDNFNMQYLTTVATVDATKQTSFSYTCPKVTPHSMIYFYQFSNPAAPLNNTWTGRFAITDSTGTTTPPTENTNGIAWGNGMLVDKGSAAPEPSYLTNPTATGGSTSAPSSTTGGNVTARAPPETTVAPGADGAGAAAEETTTSGHSHNGKGHGWKGSGSGSEDQQSTVETVTATAVASGATRGGPNDRLGSVNANSKTNAAGVVGVVGPRLLIGVVITVLVHGNFVF